MRLHLSASGWIPETPPGVRLAFWADPTIGAPPSEIRVERAVLADKRPSWVGDDDSPSWLGAPASWWSRARTIHLAAGPPLEWDLGSAVQGVSFDYEGRRALVRGTLRGVTVWSRTVEPSETVHIAAPCDRVTLRATDATLHSARLLGPAAGAEDLTWTRVATVLVRVGLSRPWSAVEPRVRGLMSLDDDKWRALAGAVAGRYDSLLPAGAPFEASEREILLGAAWRIAAACGFGWRDGPREDAGIDDVDAGAVLGRAPSRPLAYRIIDPAGRWLPSAPVAVPAGWLAPLRRPSRPSVGARVRLGHDGSLVAERLLAWRLGDPLADRGGFEQKVGDDPPAPEWETRARIGARPDDSARQVSTLIWPTPHASVAVRQRAGDQWGRRSAWSAWTSAVPELDHHPSAPPLIAVFADPGATPPQTTVRLGTMQSATDEGDRPPRAPWRPDSLTLALRGRVQLLRRRAPPEVLDVMLSPPVSDEGDLWRFVIAPAIVPSRYAGGVLAAGGVRCDVVRAERRALVVRAPMEAVSRRRLPTAGPARLLAPRGRADLWEAVGEARLPTADEITMRDPGARTGAIHALRVVFDGGAGPIGAELAAFGKRAPSVPPPEFTVHFRGFDADRRAVLVVTFAERPPDAALRIGWTWRSEPAAVPRFDAEPLVPLDGDRTFLSRLAAPDRDDALPFVCVWIAREEDVGFGPPAGPQVISPIP